ncbi:fused MFS/spermidine synthase [Paraliomyxa miuraensis]|uniref:fused MFS/spermidine synthase n=1 Tax=Paraliomyxa miuraensis TaxID=376150 RepID=UPI0022509BA4|nr:fused MFS/spermidine synthase [Paraliomyxa miuraensis]MCX4244886.1 fused MFS/spermidine synthase [Paraliomyxa miuraensis]
MARATDRTLLIAFVLSGAAGLGYEILWTRLLALALGSETLGVLGVLAGFFGGMALGAAALHGHARRAEDPVRLFVLLELCAAGFAVLSPFWLHALAGWLPGALGPWAGANDGGVALALSVGVAGLALLPGTFCLGATLPALVEARRRTQPNEPDGRGLGRLYAANTAGAVLGVLGTVHVLLPLMGVVGGAVALSCLGFAAAIVARRWAALSHRPRPTRKHVDHEEPEVDASRDPDPDVAREPWLLLALLAGTGLAGVGLEVVAIHVLSQVLENTIYTFAHVLAVYLLGTAAGAALYTRYAAPAVAGRPATVAAGLLLAHAVATIWATSALASSFELLEWIAPPGDARMATEMVAEAVTALVVLGPATMLMGALFSHVAGLLAPRGIGRAYALNTLGGALAPFVFGVWGIESLGYRDALISVAWVYLLLFGGFTWFRRFKPIPQIAGILGVVALTGLSPASLLLVARYQEPADHDDAKGDANTKNANGRNIRRYVDEAMEWEIIDSRETLLGAVVVSEFHPRAAKEPQRGSPPRRLQVGSKFYMGGGFGVGEQRLGGIPLLLHPAPERALFLGVGTGATLSAVRHHPSLTHIDAVELVPAVLDMLHHFNDINGELTKDERVHLHAADARRFVAASHDRYDVIVADLFHPGRDGAGNLYAREHFENVRARLHPGGLFAQWLPLYQLDAPTLRVVMRTFAEVFGEVHVLLGQYNVRVPAIVLVGYDGGNDDGGLVIDVDELTRRMQTPVHRELFTGPQDLLGSYLLDRDGLTSFVGPGPQNLDLVPVVATRAPKSAYEESDTRGRDNLMEILAARRPLPEGLLFGTGPISLPAFRNEVSVFGEAVEHYLQGESVLLDATLADAPTATAYVEATPHYLRAFRTEPRLVPARGALFRAASASDDLAEHVFPIMLERAPKERRVWQEYLGHLERKGDVERLRAAVQQAKETLGLPEAASP